jgi:superkiller protein 3
VCPHASLGDSPDDHSADLTTRTSSEDPIKLGEQVQKRIDLARAHLSRPALLASLALLLPDARCNGTLSLIPLPEPTAPGGAPSSTAAVQHAIHTAEGSLDVLEEIVAGWEKQELDERTKEIDKRRLRLGGGRAKTRAQIEREVFAELGRSSRLPALYAQLLYHPALSVDRLRAVEHALLVHHRTLLFAIPSKEKDAKRAERETVQELSRGVVLIRGADRDAWDAQLEWADWVTIGAHSDRVARNTHRRRADDRTSLPRAEEYPLADLKAFGRLFPEDPLTWFIQGYLLYFGLQDAEEDDESAEGSKPGKPGRKGRKLKAEEDEAAGDDAFKLLYVRDLVFPFSLRRPER